MMDSPQKETIEIGPGNLKMSFSLTSGQLKSIYNIKTGVSFSHFADGSFDIGWTSCYVLKSGPNDVNQRLLWHHSWLYIKLYSQSIKTSKIKFMQTINFVANMQCEPSNTFECVRFRYGVRFVGGSIVVHMSTWLSICSNISTDLRFLMLILKVVTIFLPAWLLF